MTVNDITGVLSRLQTGETLAADELFPLVYRELRQLAAVRMARERPDHTLQPTALVHEAYLRLVGSNQNWASRNQFYAAAANSMRQILVNWAAARRTQKRGGCLSRGAIDDVAARKEIDPELVLDLDAALSELSAEDAESSELVKLRVFAGLSVPDAGRVLNLSRSTAYESWAFARAWFADRRSRLEDGNF